MLKLVLINSILVCFFTTSYAAEDKSIIEIKRLQAMVIVINAELKSDLDQVLMLQEAVKLNSRTPLELQSSSPDVVSYDDVEASKRMAIQREASINLRLDAILTRSKELDLKKQLLLDRVIELSKAPNTQATKTNE
jgi:hypothetical protein